MIQRRWSLARPDGTEIVADVRLPEGEPPRSAIVVAHGFKGFKDWGFFPHLSAALVGDGHAVVSINFSLNGIGADPLEFTELEDFARNTLSRELDELLAVVEAVSGGEVLSPPPRRIGVFGHSRGGGIAVLAARESPHVDALVSWAAVSDFDRWDEATKAEWRRTGRIHVLNGRTGQQMPLDLTLLEDFEANRDRLDVTAAAGELSAPWLIVHGSDDPAVSVDDGRALDAAAPHAELCLIEGAGHTFEVGHPFQGPSEEYRTALARTRAHFRDALLGSDTPVG
ncbi:MAG: alpha/beta fold hydrolase [Gemmatimonadales bacterium]|nr:MAG: alpha/beta fold hydrolase [Gemmatimonadales bacterium]